LIKAAGAKRVIPLKVSAPFHSQLMEPAAKKLAGELDKIEIKDASVPVVANFTAEPVTDGKMIRELLIKQVTGSVLWEDSVKRMVKDGVGRFVEVGPGNVLAGLIKKIDSSVEVISYVQA
jgi:[acyl-carrier-protein] S-malonyltransferase